jgi:repressor LexA
MRSKNPVLMEKISLFVSNYHRINGHSPSTNEIAKAVGIGKTTAYRYLLEMNDRNMISYDGQMIETSQTDKCRSGYFSAPIVGTIRCGDPETEEEYVEEYVSLPDSIFGKGDFYILRAVGDSMEDAGISGGDLVVIRKQVTAVKGDIVVALDDENRNTLKRYAGYDEVEGCHLLAYENEEMYPGKIIKVRELVIQGVACHVIKTL